MTKKHELQPDLLEDFYGEADEHLTAIRETLIRLEAELGKALESKDIEELFRRFHSFKGIASIVGLVAAENLAHVTEDLLRGFRQKKKPFTQREWNYLMSAAQALEQLVVAFKLDQPFPDLLTLTHEIGSLLETDGQPGDKQVETPGKPGAENLKEPSKNLDDDDANRRFILWRCQFVPSRELDERGINVNSVRTRLEKAGEIIRVEPKVLGKGSVSFEFILRTRETPPDIADWEAEGIRTELIEDRRLQQPRSDAPAGMESLQFPFIAPSQIIRVDLKKLDEMMRIVGEMVIQKSRFEKFLENWEDRNSESDRTALKEINIGFSRALREIREAIMGVRLVPVAEIFARMPFVSRDLARETGKKARLILEGQQTEIDKYLIERLKEPLLHLVRNAFAHGIETPAERAAMGKPEEATILLKAATMSDSVIIQIRDDGRGLDRKAITRKAASQGIAVPPVLDDNAMLQILATPGFSTREEADLTAGRGVGMSVVWNTVRELGGNLSMESRVGHGTQFTLRMPLTVAILEAFIVAAGEQSWAVPQHYVSEIAKINAADLHQVNKQDVIAYRDGVLPVTKLTSYYKLPDQLQKSYIMLVLESERGRAGLIVDSIHGQKEVVVRAMKDPLLQVPGISGATELGDGKPVLILDITALLKGAVRPLDKIQGEKHG
ncbi:MAG: chemotaxis protein CheA [Verrucomicrobiales bacterium]